MESGYRQGYTQGVADGLSKVNIQYTYHVHQGTEGTTANGCYTKPVYHTHSSCYRVCGGHQYTISTHSSYIMVRCESCGAETKEIKDYNSFICGQAVLKCGKTTSTVEKYTLGCGKTEDTIESATIIY